MKVILKKTMLERIAEAQDSARRANREIEKIVLTRDEANQLELEVGHCLSIYRTGIDFRQTKVMGIDIEIERSE